MGRYAVVVMLRAMTAAFLMASAVAVASALPAAASPPIPPLLTSCPISQSAVTDVEYVVFHADGTSDDVTTLAGNVRLGDMVNALFNVPVLPSRCSSVQLSLASYSSSGRRAAGKQRLFSSDTGQFLPGGRYEMSVTIVPPPSPGAPREYFTLAFATGPVLTRPHYGPQLIGSTRN